MKNRTKILTLLSLLFVVVVGCAPKIPYKKPHKRLKNCGCEQLAPQLDYQNLLIPYYYV
jgi:hypothetical protein